ncbi:MAG: hypothetical protein AVDCRST_MAG22-2075 [uncultured Rubrobacteraceae bacterium]|uniref:Uncharacterized protein n=1 Tax=uncultured Rubrobacteraceae bacterium TaxID=349277 RepID=A0A6J4PIK1_9ACTN|nr:MAG: hypothetical protein AVDCRST_MAG22-2075 [uncultured Rubrobacteraceae bacterium]
MSNSPTPTARVPNYQLLTPSATVLTPSVFSIFARRTFARVRYQTLIPL